MTNNELTLRFLSPDRFGQLVRLPQARCSIGADENCTLRVSAQGVRPVHCFIVRGPETTVVRRWSPDTRLNGQPFRDAALHAGDRLSLGPVELEVVDGAPPSAAEQEATNLKQQMAAREAELTALRELLHAARSLADESDAQRRSLAAKLAAAEERQAGDARRFDEQLQSFAKLQADWRRERDDLLSRCAHWQAECDAAAARAEEAETARRAFAESSSRKEAIAAENLLRLQGELEQLRAALAQHQDAASAELARWQDAATQREAQLAEFDAEQHSWQEQRQRLAAQLDEQRGQVAALHQELAASTRQLEARPAGADAPTSECSTTIEALDALERLRETVLCDGDAEEAGGVDERAEAASAADDGSEMSIDNYMSQLMQRVRGKSEEEQPSPAPKVASLAPNAAHVLPPRTIAPEQPHSLQAMRELANQSARTAIDASRQRRWINNLRAKSAVSVALAICGVLLVGLSDGLLSRPMLGAAGSFALAGLFTWQTWRMRCAGPPAKSA